MATYNAIAAVTHTVLSLLRDACPRDVFPEARFDPQELTNESRPGGDSVTLLLYRVSLNGRRAVHQAPRADGRRLRPAIGLDLFYLLSVWGRTVEQQQRLLGWCVRELANHASLPAGVLNQHHLGPTDTFNPTEDLELSCEPLALQDLSSLWDVMKPHVPLSMAYVVHMVPIDSLDLIPAETPVQTRCFDMGVPA